MQHLSWFISSEKKGEKKRLQCAALLTKNVFAHISNNQLNHLVLLVLTVKATKHLSIKENAHTHAHTHRE